MTSVRDWLNTKMADLSTTVVVSHPDKDHMSLLTEDGVIPERATALLVGRTLEHYPPAFRSWAEKVRSAPQGFGAAEVAISDDRFSCHPAEVDVLTANVTLDPQTGEFGSSKNADSTVVRLRFGASSVIVTGDAEGVTEQSALDNAAAQGVSLAETSLLLGSHHGARTHGSNGQAWLDATSPKAVAYSARLASSYHHPQCEVVKRAAVAAAPAAGEFDFSCGLGNTALGTLRVRSRVLSTHINGHVLVRMGSTEIRYLCQLMSPACDEPLLPEMLPR